MPLSSPERIAPHTSPIAPVLDALPALLLPCYVLAALIASLWLPPLAQDPAYHHFADDRHWLGLANFADVVSNLAILLAAAWGLAVSLRTAAPSERFATADERRYASLYFGALVLTAMGSTWYHLAPDNARLFWDRLPLSLAFTALLALLITERVVLTRAARLLLGLWVVAGPVSVLYWQAGELSGQGDLRPYFLLYVFMFLLLPVLIAAPTPYTHNRLYGWAYALFVLAMAGDRLDHAVYAMTGQLISGHTLKHLLMGVAIALLAHMFACRRRRHSQASRKLRSARS